MSEPDDGWAIIETAADAGRILASGVVDSNLEVHCDGLPGGALPAGLRVDGHLHLLRATARPLGDDTHVTGDLVIDEDRSEQRSPAADRWQRVQCSAHASRGSTYRMVRRG